MGKWWLQRGPLVLALGKPQVFQGDLESSTDSLPHLPSLPSKQLPGAESQAEPVGASPRGRSCSCSVPHFGGSVACSQPGTSSFSLPVRVAAREQKRKQESC